MTSSDPRALRTAGLGSLVYLVLAGSVAVCLAAGIGVGVRDPAGLPYVSLTALGVLLQQRVPYLFYRPERGAGEPRVSR